MLIAIRFFLYFDNYVKHSKLCTALISSEAQSEMKGPAHLREKFFIENQTSVSPKDMEF